MAACLLAHDQVGGVDVVHLLADAVHSVPQPQHILLQVMLRHAVHHVDGLALDLGHDLGVIVDVIKLLYFDFQGWRWMKERQGRLLSTLNCYLFCCVMLN